MSRHKWADIKARVRLATRARMEAEARQLSDELHLSQLRKARGLTQEAMADLLGDTGLKVRECRGSRIAQASVCSLDARPRRMKMRGISRFDAVRPVVCPTTERYGRHSTAHH